MQSIIQDQLYQTYNNKINKMKRTFSPTRSKPIHQLHNTHKHQQHQRRLPISRTAQYHQYFCHYNNAVYMGGMSSYKKHGKGLLLHDDGSAVITDYLHDTPSGHSVIFRQNSITSVFYKSNVQFQVAYKQGKYIITIPFCDSSYKAHGVGVLIDYINFKIYRLVFKRGALVEKIMHLDNRDNDDVFSKNTTTKIIGVKHQQAFNLNFDKPNKLHIKQQANKTTIGYFDQDGQIHGLSFTFYGQNVRTNGERSLYLKFIEKGYYRESTLQTFGEKLFSNGNKYIGQFDKGQFHGYGILISPSEMKWVHGKFNRGQLQQILDSNYKKFTQQQFQVWAQSLRIIHRRYRQRWIDMDIELPEQNYLYNTLKLGVESPTTYIDPDKVQTIRQDQARMNRIQQHFQKQQPGSTHHSNVEKELDQHYSYVRPKLSINTRPQVIQQSVARSNYTPSNKFQPISSSRLKSPRNAQIEFRQQDPFKLELKKVPYDSQNEDYREPVVSHKSRLQNRAPLEQTVFKSSRQNYLPYSYMYDYGYRNKYRFNNHIDSVYDSGHLQELRKQRQRLNNIEDDQLYYSRLRRGLESSPIHRNYYTTPPKYDEHYPYPQRYVGKLTNKRVFNYPDTSSTYYPQEVRPSLTNSRANAPSLYQSPRHKKSPKKQIEQGYNSRMRNVSPKEQNESRRNFIKNNYSYWNSS